MTLDMDAYHQMTDAEKIKTLTVWHDTLRRAYELRAEDMQRARQLAQAGIDGGCDIVEALCVIRDLMAGEDVREYADAVLANA